MRGKIRKKLILSAYALLLGIILVGCGNGDRGKADESQGVDSEASGVSNAGSGVGETSESNHKEREEDASIQGEEGIFYTYQEIALTFPAAWKDRYVIEEYENGEGFSVYQKASYDREEGYGFLFSIGRSEEPVYDMPGGGAVAYTKDCMYYVSYPTDVPYIYEDQDIAEDYGDMALYLDIIENSVQISGEGVHDNPEEYVMPMSEYYPLREDMLLNFNDNQLMLARNEIYARHGYHFKNEFLTRYFDRYSWYVDRGDDFDEGELSQVEKDNIKVIKEMEERYAAEHPYPMEEDTGTTVYADLDGDGTKEKLSYEVRQVSEYEEHGILTIEGKTYDLWGYENIYMEYPDSEHFYLTDISPYFDGLEIAVTEEGPSDDPATHFYIYEGELSYIGSVSGYPMKQKENLNGFHDGGVTGIERQSLIETYECYDSWWYDYENRELVYQDVGYFEMVPKPAHGLLMDLPVYTQMNEESPMTTLKAQDEVFFMATDGKEWLLVRGKDGTAGYIHITDQIIDTVDKPADEVFTGLMFYD
ncbi:MAG: YARHG domain-containing protein [Lachnospiraceae bacterium]